MHYKNLTFFSWKIVSLPVYSLKERVLDATKNIKETVTSKCHVGTYFAKWFDA